MIARRALWASRCWTASATRRCSRWTGSPRICPACRSWARWSGSTPAAPSRTAPPPPLSSTPRSADCCASSNAQWPRAARRHQRQHRHRLRHAGRGAGLSRHPLRALQRLRGAQAHPRGLRRGGRLDRPRRRLRRRNPQGARRWSPPSPTATSTPTSTATTQNWKAHYRTTANEIWKQTEGQITHFVAGLGTSGTFMGTTRRLQASSTPPSSASPCSRTRPSTASRA